MKRPILTFILLLIFAGSFAQDYTQAKDKSSDEEINTLFKKPKHEKKDISVGWTVGLNSAYTQYDKRNVWLAGFTAGPILNHNWTVGIQLNAVVNSHNLYFDSVVNNTGAYLIGGYGGFLIQYTLFPKSVVHVTFPLQIGGGYLGFLSDYGYEWQNGHGYWNGNGEILEYDVFFFVEPGIQAEFNLLKFMRLALGVSYRYTPYFQFETTTSDLFNSFNGTVGLKFGKF